ncbi:unnamed protein product [Amoebophrya sp. A120]|nr:unnamed protein product [Amoebophrya sp. A120]|eukprot:GSA120T00010982001.1
MKVVSALARPTTAGRLQQGANLLGPLFLLLMASNIQQFVGVGSVQGALFVRAVRPPTAQKSPQEPVEPYQDSSWASDSEDHKPVGEGGGDVSDFRPGQAVGSLLQLFQGREPDPESFLHFEAGRVWKAQTPSEWLAQQNQFLDAARKGKFEQVEEMLRWDPELVNARGGQAAMRDTALMQAAYFGDVKAITMLSRVNGLDKRLQRRPNATTCPGCRASEIAWKGAGGEDPTPARFTNAVNYLLRPEDSRLLKEPPGSVRLPVLWDNRDKYVAWLADTPGGGKALLLQPQAEYTKRVPTNKLSLDLLRNERGVWTFAQENVKYTTMSDVQMKRKAKKSLMHYAAVDLLTELENNGGVGGFNFVPPADAVAGLTGAKDSPTPADFKNAVDYLLRTRLVLSDSSVQLPAIDVDHQDHQATYIAWVKTVQATAASPGGRALLVQRRVDFDKKNSKNKLSLTLRYADGVWTFDQESSKFTTMPDDLKRQAKRALIGFATSISQTQLETQHTAYVTTLRGPYELGGDAGKAHGGYCAKTKSAVAPRKGTYTASVRQVGKPGEEGYDPAHLEWNVYYEEQVQDVGGMVPRADDKGAIFRLWRVVPTTAGGQFGPVTKTKLSAAAMQATLPAAPKSTGLIFYSAKASIDDAVHAPENAGAVFVLPSQLNGAEYPSPDPPVYKINAYFGDPTGGPRGQLAVHPSAGQFVLDNAANTKSDGKGISAVKEMLQSVNQRLRDNCFHGVEATTYTRIQFDLHNGYLRMPVIPKTVENAEEAAACVAQSFADNLYLMRTPRTDNVQANGINGGGNEASFYVSDQRVSLVYASAIPHTYADCHDLVDNQMLPREGSCGSYGRYEKLMSTREMYDNNNPTVKMHRKIEIMALVGQYYGALRQTACLHMQEMKSAGTTTKIQEDKDKKRIFLMPLGGGVFRNDMETVIKPAVVAAVKLLSPAERAALKIVMLAYPVNTFEVEALKQLAEENELDAADASAGVKSPTAVILGERKQLDSTGFSSLHKREQQQARKMLQRLKNREFEAWARQVKKFCEKKPQKCKALLDFDDSSRGLETALFQIVLRHKSGWLFELLKYLQRKFFIVLQKIPWEKYKQHNTDAPNLLSGWQDYVQELPLTEEDEQNAHALLGKAKDFGRGDTLEQQAKHDFGAWANELTELCRQHPGKCGQFLNFGPSRKRRSAVWQALLYFIGMDGKIPLERRLEPLQLIATTVTKLREEKDVAHVQLPKVSQADYKFLVDDWPGRDAAQGTDGRWQDFVEGEAARLSEAEMRVANDLLNYAKANNLKTWDARVKDVCGEANRARWKCPLFLNFDLGGARQTALWQVILYHKGSHAPEGPKYFNFVHGAYKHQLESHLKKIPWSKFYLSGRDLHTLAMVIEEPFSLDELAPGWHHFVAAPDGTSATVDETAVADQLRSLVQKQQKRETLSEPRQGARRAAVPGRQGPTRGAPGDGTPALPPPKIPATSLTRVERASALDALQLAKAGKGKAWAEAVTRSGLGCGTGHAQQEKCREYLNFEDKGPGAAFLSGGKGKTAVWYLLFEGQTPDLFSDAAIFHEEKYRQQLEENLVEVQKFLNHLERIPWLDYKRVEESGHVDEKLLPPGWIIFVDDAHLLRRMDLKRKDSPMITPYHQKAGFLDLQPTDSGFPAGLRPLVALPQEVLTEVCPRLQDLKSSELFPLPELLVSDKWARRRCGGWKAVEEVLQYYLNVDRKVNVVKIDSDWDSFWMFPRPAFASAFVACWNQAYPQIPRSDQQSPVCSGRSLR